MLRITTMLAALAFATPTLAQDTRCEPYPSIAAMLTDQYGERRTSVGLEARGGLVEVWVNPENGSWTLVGVMPGGSACLVLWGEAWQGTVPPAGDPT